MPTEFEWDEKKRRANLRKHRLDFRDASEAFEEPTIELADDLQVYGEDRWLELAFLHGRVVAIVYSRPRPNTIRVISLRLATTHEQQIFEAEVRDRLGTSGSDD